MKTDFWVSVLLAIPLAIAANLITPRVRAWLDKRAERGARQRRERTQKQRDEIVARIRADIGEIESFRIDRSRLHEFLLEMLIRATLYSAIGGVYAGLLFGFVEFYVVSRAIAPAAQLITVMTSLMVFQVCWRGLRVIRRVRNFDSWKKDLEQEIERLTPSLPPKI